MFGRRGVCNTRSVRRFVVLAAVVLAGCACVFFACSVDPELTCGAPCADVSVEAACTYVSSCFDAGIPDGWSPVAAFPTSANPQCPAGFTERAPPLVTGTATGCCGCKTAGKWSCVGTLATGAGDCEDDEQSITATSACVVLDASATMFSAAVGLSDAGPSCNATTQDGGVVTTPAVMCLPGCGTDVCGASSESFRVCVYREGQATCPTGFPNAFAAGANLGVVCNGCDCAMSIPSACSFTAEAFADNDCDAATGTVYASTACRDPKGISQIGSVAYTSSAPSASCKPIIDASITMTNEVTICCQ
jgi:hypothetical protein